MVELRANKFGSLPVRAARKLFRQLKTVMFWAIRKLPFFHFIDGYHGKQAPITFSIWFLQKFIGINRKAYWGMHFSSKVVQPQNIMIGKDSNPGIEPGCYIQGIGRIYIGDYTQVAANTSIISANHDPYDLEKSIPSHVSIGSYCWIGAHAVILPGVTLGDFTVVGAGSVVTKPFPEGYCVIAGNPARRIRSLDRESCKKTTSRDPYVGYIRAGDFIQFRKDHLWV